MEIDAKSLQEKQSLLVALDKRILNLVSLRSEIAGEVANVISSQMGLNPNSDTLKRISKHIYVEYAESIGMENKEAEAFINLLLKDRKHGPFLGKRPKV